MSRPRFGCSLGLLALLGWSSIQAVDLPQRQWRFTVLLDGKPVGHHHVDLDVREGTVEYRSETKLGVKILFVPVFRYLHVDQETWRDDCLTRIESSTDDDGKALFVRGTRGESSFAITTEHGDSELPATCVMTFAYWNPRVLTATRLMNAQSGKYVPVQVTALGSDRVRVKGAEIAAERYAIVGDKLNIELWYAAEGRWVALSTTTEGGSRLQYVLQ